MLKMVKVMTKAVVVVVMVMIMKVKVSESQCELRRRKDKSEKRRGEKRESAFIYFCVLPPLLSFLSSCYLPTSFPSLLKN